MMVMVVVVTMTTTTMMTMFGLFPTINLVSFLIIN